MKGERLLCTRCNSFFFDTAPDFQDYLVKMCPFCYGYGFGKTFDSLNRVERKTVEYVEKGANNKGLGLYMWRCPICGAGAREWHGGSDARKYYRHHMWDKHGGSRVDEYHLVRKGVDKE